MPAVFAAIQPPTAALAQQPLVIKFSHVVSPDAPKGKAANYFKEVAPHEGAVPVAEPTQ